MSSIKCIYFEKNNSSIALRRMIDTYVKNYPSNANVLQNNNYHFGYMLNEYCPDNKFPYNVLGFMIVCSIFQQGDNHINFNILCGFDENIQEHFDLLYKKTQEHIENNVPYKNYTIFLSIPQKNCIDLLMTGHEIIQELPQKMFLMRKNFC